VETTSTCTEINCCYRSPIVSPNLRNPSLLMTLAILLRRASRSGSRNWWITPASVISFLAASVMAWCFWMSWCILGRVWFWGKVLLLWWMADGKDLVGGLHLSGGGYGKPPYTTSQIYLSTSLHCARQGYASAKKRSDSGYLSVNSTISEVNRSEYCS